MKILAKYAIPSLIDWVVRRKSPALVLVRVGLGLVALVVSGWAAEFSIPVQNGPFTIKFDNGGGNPTIITYTLAGLGIALIVGGSIWEILRHRDEKKRLLRKKVIVVETRGLRDTSGTPLVEAIPPTIEGQRDQLLIDLRQRIQDDVIVHPEASLKRLMHLPSALEGGESGLDRRDLTIIYGGLLPVPFSFLAGTLVDDEGVVQVYDWDRHRETWRPLDEDDDGQRFTTTGLEDVFPGTAEVVLCISVSYRVDLDGVRRKFDGIPMVHLNLKSGSPDCHWSAEKQEALGKQFLDTVIALGNLSITRIHLFLSAQNSIVFRFRRLYDKRNLPEVAVYQYQRENDPPHPWGVLMPVAGIEQPVIV
jgi:hypothetical protein